MLRRKAVPCIALGIAGLVSSAAADTFRCGPHLIREGMRVVEIVEKCGAPATKDVIEEPIIARRNGSTYQVGTRRIEHWTYDRGALRFRALVTVEAGSAREIELVR